MSYGPHTQEGAKLYDIPGGKCWLYPHCPTGKLSFAYVEEEGRYPEKGYRKNERCTEAFFVLEGELTLTIGGEGGEVHVLRQHDLFYVPLNTPYSVDGKGKSIVFIEPEWDSAQNIQVD